MKPEELRELASKTAHRLHPFLSIDPDPDGWREIRDHILTALQQAVDGQREEDARLCERQLWEVGDHPSALFCQAADAIRAGKQTVQEESDD